MENISWPTNSQTQLIRQSKYHPTNDLHLSHTKSCVMHVALRQRRLRCGRLVSSPLISRLIPRFSSADLIRPPSPPQPEDEEEAELSKATIEGGKEGEGGREGRREGEWRVATATMTAADPVSNWSRLTRSRTQDSWPTARWHTSMGISSMIHKVSPI